MWCIKWNCNTQQFPSSIILMQISCESRKCRQELWILRSHAWKQNSTLECVWMWIHYLFVGLHVWDYVFMRLYVRGWDYVFMRLYVRVCVIMHSWTHIALCFTFTFNHGTQSHYDNTVYWYISPMNIAGHFSLATHGSFRWNTETYHSIEGKIQLVNTSIITV